MTDGTEHMIGIYLLIAAGLVVATLGVLGAAVLTRYLFWSGANGRRKIP